jgi:Ca2+-binding EF-hand superfamily protein
VKDSKTSKTPSKVNWKEIHDKLPMTKSTADTKKRAAMFKQFDPNGNGYLSLAEIDKGIRDVLECETLFDAKPAIIRAF